MNPFAKLHLFLIILLSCFTGNLSLPHDNQKPRTIFDYYLMVPHSYLQLPGVDSRARRESAISIKDVENGYLQIRQPVGETYTALSLFKSPEGTDVIAVEARSCPAGCFSKLTLLLYQNDQWRDVTREKLPVIDDVTLNGILNKQVAPRKDNFDFRPRILYSLPRGATVIDMSEIWSGMEVGQLAWEGGQFVFKPVASAEFTNRHAVLASVSNEAGDRLQLIGFSPQHPIKLPINGHLSVSVAYQLTSASGCRIRVKPVVNEKRLADRFTSGSMLHKQGSGIVTSFFGFTNQAHIDQIKVVMEDEQRKELLTLTFDVDADWEGVMECPSLQVECFPTRPKSEIIDGCTVYQSGLKPGQHLTYHWALSDGEILSGQGTHHIRIDTGGNKNVTASVEVGGLGRECAKNATFAIPATKLADLPSRRERITSTELHERLTMR